MFADALLVGYGKKKEEDGFGVIEKVFQPFDLLSFAEERLNVSKQVPPPTVDTKYRISGLGYLCARAEAIKAKHNITYTQKVDSSLQKTFDFGHAFHSLIQDKWLGKWGVLEGDWKCCNCGKLYVRALMPDKCVQCGCSDEFKYVEIEIYSKEHGLTGHPDGVLVHNGFKYVPEFKTTSSASYDSIGRTRRPLESHIAQINLYMYFLEIKHGIIVYFEKDTSRWMQFHVEANMAIVDKYLNKISLSRRSIANGTIPERVECAKKDCAMAKRCPVSKICFSI